MGEQLTKKRIYKYDNVKALLIFLVVIGHMTTDYVSDSHMVRWITLWIYTFHMPAFIFLSGLVHKQYITEADAAAGVKGETKMRWDKFLGFFFCGYGLKIFLQLTRTLMGQNPLWHWIEEPGIPWYLFVMAEYELFFYLIRKVTRRTRPWIIVAVFFAISAAAGYFPVIGDTFCLSRMINFLPIYALGYFIDMRVFLDVIEGRGLGGGVAEAGAAGGKGSGTGRLIKAGGLLVIIASMVVCYRGNWGMYSWRKWFTGRRSYEFLADFFDYAVRSGWWIRIAVWAVALAITFALIALIPDKDLKFGTVMGARTLQVYFWHRPVCYLFRTLEVLPRLTVLFGGTYNAAVAGQVRGLAFGGSEWSMAAALLVYCLIGAAMTAFFSLKIFEHPTKELMAFGSYLAGRLKRD